MKLDRHSSCQTLLISDVFSNDLATVGCDHPPDAIVKALARPRNEVSIGGGHGITETQPGVRLAKVIQNLEVGA